MCNRMIYLICAVLVVGFFGKAVDAQNQIRNWEFDEPFVTGAGGNPDTHWWLWESGNFTGLSVVQGAGMSGDNAMKVEIPDGATGSLQVIQSFLMLEQGVTYTISFMAKADAPRTISVKLQGRTTNNWTVYWNQGGIDLTTEPQTFSFEYTHTGPTVGGTGNFNGDIDWYFDHGGSDVDTYYDHIWLGVGPPPPPVGAIVSATEPNPADGATDVPRDVVLSWTPGDFAAPVNGHTVYLSDSFRDVNDGVGGVVQDTNSYAPPERLEFETTYYWRVDEVNAPPDSTVFPGRIWSFTTEPVGYPVDGANIMATASSVGQAGVGPEKTIDGSGLNANDLHSTQADDMWLSGNEPSGAWIQYEFDTVYKLHEMWVWNSNQVFEGLFGFGFKDVTVEYSTNGVDWTALAGVPEFTRAPGVPGYAHDTTVDFGGATAKYIKLTATSNWGGVLPQYSLSEVRFFYIPVIAREPSPASGATDVSVDSSLAWRPGRVAGTHDLYLSTNQQAVIDGTVPAVSVTDARYNTSLELGSTYYWRVDEVNEVETPTTWQGDVWNFSTPEYLLVESFEDYNDYPSYEIYSTWLDGYENPANGSQVGYLTPPIAETTIVHGGAQSMPFIYSNTGGAAYSETTRTFAFPQDWTKYGIQTLVLYFQGTPGNTGQLYLKVNGIKVPYSGAAADLALPLWNQWNIDLPSLGTNLTSVTTLAIGIDGNGAAGTLFVDDIVLYRSAPPQPTEKIYFEAEAGSITAPMTVRDDPLASGGQYIGTDDGIGDENNNPPADGIAMYNFTSQGGIYKIALRVIITGGSNSFWVRIPGATNYDPGTHTSGWIRFNDISDGAEWHWDEVHSSDHNDEVVSITVPAGPQTLEIARREDGALLDAIVMSKID